MNNKIKSYDVYRNKNTGQFCKPLYELYLHDFPNFSIQLIKQSENKKILENEADNINNLLINVGRNKELKAIVYLSNETELIT